MHRRVLRQGAGIAAVVLLVTSSSRDSAHGLSANELQPIARVDFTGEPIWQVAEKASEPAVEIVRHGDPPLLVLAPPGTAELEWMTELSAAVLVIQPGDKRSSITEDGKWIVSDVRATVLEVLKDTTAHFSVGQDMVFREEGGRMSVGSRVVSASLEWARPFTVNRTYLVSSISRLTAASSSDPQTLLKKTSAI